MASAVQFSRQPLPAAVLRFVRQQPRAPDAWLIAVSGGPDSVALLHAVTLLGRDHGWGVQAGHFNHQLRGQDSDADEAFVRELCASMAVPFHGTSIPVRELSRQEGENLEATARTLRYQWFRSEATARGLDWIATGHHADDQAETVLHHLLRGTGLRGLRGIAAFRRFTADLALVRPFLTVSRAEIHAYLELHGLAYRQDHTNADTSYTRNWVRHELLPLLRERFHAEVPAHLVQLAEQARDWQDFLAAQAAALVHRAEKPRVGSLLILDQADMSAAPAVLIREAFHLLWEREGWPRGAMTAAHWERMAEVALGKHVACELPGNLHLRHQGRVLQVGPKT